MKYIRKITLLIVALTFSAQLSAQTAVSYMEKISAETRKIQEDMWDYTNAVSHGKSARKVEKRRTELLKTSQQALNRVKNMAAFNGSTAYRDSMATFLQINYLVLKEDYAKIVDMEEIAEKSYDNMEAYLMAKEEANDKMSTSSEMVRREQAVFAAANNITLISSEDELDKKMAIANEVYTYYNKVYLIFFKSYIQESYLMTSMMNKDVNGIQQNKNALASTVKEGLSLIKEIKPFKGSDNSIVTTCKNMLNFYADEVEKMDIITDFFLKDENFKAVKSSFDQIKEKNRTQEDVDRYNGAINDLNAAVASFNKTNDELNENRAKNLEAWNKSVSKFTDKHVPRN